MPDSLTPVPNEVLQHFDSGRTSLGDKEVHLPFPTQTLTMPDVDWYLVQLKIIPSRATAASGPRSYLCRLQPGRCTRTDTGNEDAAGCEGPQGTLFPALLDSGSTQASPPKIHGKLRKEGWCSRGGAREPQGYGFTRSQGLLPLSVGRSQRSNMGGQKP